MPPRSQLLLVCLTGLIVMSPGGDCAESTRPVDTPSTIGQVVLEDTAAPNSSPLPPLPTSPSGTIDHVPHAAHIVLPPLEEELGHHGGSYLYEPSDVAELPYLPHEEHFQRLRLPENWEEPQPFSLPDDYLGSNLITFNPRWSWLGAQGFQWEPRLVGYGRYELFGALYEENDTRRDGIGHQLILDFDLALTGTERIHLQFRPLGEDNSGGSFWQLNDPTGYDDNSTGVPQRWWIEGEFQSLFGHWLRDAHHQWDVNFTLGKFPFLLHNGLLMNDEIIGVAIGKNTILDTPLSNLNVQLFYAFDDVDAFPVSSDLLGLHVTGDYRHAFLEATYARLFHSQSSGFDTDYLAFSATKFFGPLTLAGRVMAKFNQNAATGNGQLYVLESNYTRLPAEWFTHATGIESTVTYVNLFKATSGWSPISGGNFDRVRNTFTLNPLLNIAAGRAPAETIGAAVGVQLFRHHEDESIIPELAVEEQSADTAWGVGLRYQRKLCPRVFLEIRGLKTWSDVAALEREGAFVSTFVIF